jgi:hypothetical protein
MPFMPNDSQNQSPERRLRLDRRVGERRQRNTPVPRNRRISNDRRLVLDRREGAISHIRNAIQLLRMISTGALHDAEAQAAVHAASHRLWSALDEIDRLQLLCTLLGHKVRLEDRSWQPEKREA